MTAKELIEALEKFPGELHVMFDHTVPSNLEMASEIQGAHLGEITYDETCKVNRRALDNDESFVEVVFLEWDY